MSEAITAPDTKSAEGLGKIYDCLKSQQAPAQTGKGFLAKHLEIAKMAGVRSIRDIIGQKLHDEDAKGAACPLNFGSKASTGVLPEETRLNLFYLKKAFSNVEIQATYKAAKERSPYTLDLIKSVPLYKHQLEPMLKAFNVTDFADWIDQVQARFFFEEFEIPYLLADQFDNMPMSSPLVRVPGALGLLEGELEADDGIFTVQSNTQASYLVESKNNVVHTKITQDLLDDSSPAIIEKLRKEVVKGIVRSYERAMLDGDSSGTHIDDDTQAGSAKLYTKAWNGLRKRAFDNEAALGGTGLIVYDHSDALPSKALWSELLKRTKCQGSEKSDLVYIYGCSTGHDLVTGAIPELFTAFAFGGLASNVTGQVPPVFGVQGVESQLVREDLETDGKADNPTSGTQTYMLLVQKSRFSNWTRQATRVFASPSLPSSDEMLMTGKARHAFAGIPQSTTERSVVMGINVKTVP